MSSLKTASWEMMRDFVIHQTGPTIGGRLQKFHYRHFSAIVWLSRDWPVVSGKKIVVPGKNLCRTTNHCHFFHMPQTVERQLLVSILLCVYWLNFNGTKPYRYKKTNQVQINETNKVANKQTEHWVSEHRGCSTNKCVGGGEERKVFWRGGGRGRILNWFFPSDYIWFLVGGGGGGCRIFNYLPFLSPTTL